MKGGTDPLGPSKSAPVKDGFGYGRFHNFFIKENKALLACLAKTLVVSLKRDLSESIIPKYWYSFTVLEGNCIQKWELQVGLLEITIIIIVVSILMAITTEFLQSV